MISLDEEEGNGNDDLPNVSIIPKVCQLTCHSNQCMLGRGIYYIQASHYERLPKSTPSIPYGN